MWFMKKVLGCFRRADSDWNLIENGDCVALGLSGGKDSLLLLHTLKLYRLFSKKDFTVKAITLDMGFDGFGYMRLKQYCKDEGIEYEIRHTGYGKLIFEERKEKNPCALCSKLRRGALSDMAKGMGCNKLALAHNMDDVLETLLMNVLYGGRMDVFRPKAYLSRANITLIRPFVYLPENDIVKTAAKLALPIEKSGCPADGKTSRERIKQLLADLQASFPDCKDKLFHALKSREHYSLWEERD